MFNLNRWRSFRFEETIRAEILSPEKLEQLALSLAVAQSVTKNPKRGKKLRARIRANAKILVDAYRAITQQVHRHKAITPAASWLVEHFTVVEEQLLGIQENLPASYYSELPKLASGVFKGYPRIYSLSWSYCAHTDSNFEPETFVKFLKSYQQVQALTVGELWAAAATLRIVMLENLRRIAIKIVGSQIEREEADSLADDLLGLGKISPHVAEKQLYARSREKLPISFAVQLVQRLRYQDQATPVLAWLEGKLSEQGTTADDIVSLEHSSQTFSNVTVRNILTSFRSMAIYDWKKIFESLSLVDEVLKTSASFNGVDFVTKDRYRHNIEDLARKSRHSEIEVARALVLKVEQNMGVKGDPDDRTHDIGHYLISRGRPQFEKEMFYVRPWHQQLTQIFARQKSLSYMVGILIGTLGLLNLPMHYSVGLPLYFLWVLGSLGLFPASEIAISFINRLISERLVPQALPRLHLENGVPSELRTFVVIPTMFSRERQIREQVERIEIHYLSNAAGETYFALLADWPDAMSEKTPRDDHLLEIALSEIANLNERYPIKDGKRFYLFYRKRLWNESEKKWMGWERKRGKLHEFNRLLRGSTETSFISKDKPPENVRFVVTLDADTKMPSGAVLQLVGTLAHTLNRPRFDEKKRRVVEGYGILQPRVTPSLPTRRESSIYQKLFSGPSGIDPYAFAVSDLYQDLFQEGSYTGKGIYDVDAFEKSLDGRIPTNALLSHDLFESNFARCGFVSDIEFFEEFPSHCEVAFSRSHRWVRGDWQLLPWILNPIKFKGMTFIGWWKMVDNLRRSLTPPAIFLILSISWLLPEPFLKIWSCFAITALSLPVLLPILSDLVIRKLGVDKKINVPKIVRDFSFGLGRSAVSIVLLAHQSFLMCDAVFRTIWRLSISRKNLLQWVTASEAQLSATLLLQKFFQQFRGALTLTTVSFGIVTFFNPHALSFSFLFLFAWIVSPLVARRISQPPAPHQEAPLTPDNIWVLRKAGRKIWLFFSTFVTEGDHFLPPDNFQEDPEPIVARRSSPTNFGAYLLSVISARDFGWIGLLDMVDKLELTLNTLVLLPKFRGHFYNWYETHNLALLNPKYISSVDSGNLACHFIALAQACEEKFDQPMQSAEGFNGIRDSLCLLEEAVEKYPKSLQPKNFKLGIKEMKELLSVRPVNAHEWIYRWDVLEKQARSLLETARIFSDEFRFAKAEILIWSEAVHRDIQSHRRDWVTHFSWIKKLREFEIVAGSEADRQAWRELDFKMNENLNLRELHELCLHIASELQDSVKPEVQALVEEMRVSAQHFQTIGVRLTEIAKVSRQMFFDMDFGFLYNSDRKLFSIGYRVDEKVLDQNHYDLLASEARQTSFIAIAKGDVPLAHWFKLGRAMTEVENGPVLISWSGSMFEYLMPSLVLYTPLGSLLDQTCRTAVQTQIEYGETKNVPWGISESAYSSRDLAFTHQYSGFGVPSLALRRGLHQELVVAPYATLLAAMYDPLNSAINLARLEKVGACGTYGFYEALDFTPKRLPESKAAIIVRAYMSHHQGMSLVALNNVFHSGLMRDRFHREPIVKSAELLLQERAPQDIQVSLPHAEAEDIPNIKDTIQTELYRFHTPHLPIPSTHLLSNGRYHLMLTAAGSGYSRWNQFAITRWREDVTCDTWGSYLFIKDTYSGKVWSASYQPTRVPSEKYEVVFTEDQARILRRDGSISTELRIVLSTEDDAEVRCLKIRNRSSHTREIEVTSYNELALNLQENDISHPAFSKLFIQTEYDKELGGLIATRRPRLPGDPSIWVAHVLAVEGKLVSVEYETDRANFLGRQKNVQNPDGMSDDRGLSGSVGPVLDPILSLRAKIKIPPGGSARVIFSLMAAESRERVVAIAEKYRDPAVFDRVSTLAWTQAQIQLHHLGIDNDEALLFQRLANRALYFDPSMRPSSDLLKNNSLSISALWRFGVSGDRPIVLLRIDEEDDREIVRQLLKACGYWRIKRLAIDLIVLNERANSYTQDLQHSIETLVQGSLPSSHSEQRLGGVFTLRADLMTFQERDLLQTVARAIIVGKLGTLAQQSMRIPRAAMRQIPARGKILLPAAAVPVKTPVPILDFFNGLGGFSEDGREYVVVLKDNENTPLPWINVISNPSFGFLVSESGAGYTWAHNSRENQITPWSNDPVSDPGGEFFYLRDEDSGAIWSPTASPMRLPSTTYVTRHGHGYSRFEHSAFDIKTELVQYVSHNDPVKISRMTFTNLARGWRKISVTSYLEWVLGFSRTQTAPHIVTEMDVETNAMFASNPLNNEFGHQISFIDFCGEHDEWTADRTEFIGRNGTLAKPQSLFYPEPLSGFVGAAVDPCGSLRTTIELGAGEQVEVVFFLGQASSREHARTLIRYYREADLDQILDNVAHVWRQTLNQIQVRTPDKAMNLMLNNWLLYQATTCRLWTRSGFYQAGGAYGFRDQLQDVMALVYSRQDLAREHILRSASREFEEGDVQHWWHPSGRGVRTRISDDLLWLPFVISHYLETTSDYAILNESVGFLEGPLLTENQEDHYFEPRNSQNRSSLFDHCVRIINLSLKFGAHGLPLMGSGDWNDGMNRVGYKGKGESVWLGWFLYSVLVKFSQVATKKNETEFSKKWIDAAEKLKTSLEQESWDGEWYKRAYFDDGAPLGSKVSEECQIDSIAQSWAVISGAADEERAQIALAAATKRLVKDDLILLFDPPFDKTSLDPGYIKGYLPGVRENGGQYTHAAIWLMIAHAMNGKGDTATELFSKLNPINHTLTPESVETYEGEPYVCAADIYSVSPHRGRAGWTWYTGSASWMYRAGVENILGLKISDGYLMMDPCIPKKWPGFTLIYRHKSATYNITVENPSGVCGGVKSVELNHNPVLNKKILLEQEGTFEVRVILGS